MSLVNENFNEIKSKEWQNLEERDGAIKQNNCCTVILSVHISFEQDFGDYLESYYSVQTNEGEKISQLIAGYIDIILKKVNYWAHL